jgi:hypothetical protein
MIVADGAPAVEQCSLPQIASTAPFTARATGREAARERYRLTITGEPGPGRI